MPHSTCSITLRDSGCAASSGWESDTEVHQALIDASRESYPVSNSQYVSSASAGETSTGRASSSEQTGSPTFCDLFTETPKEEENPRWSLFEGEYDVDADKCTLRLKPEYRGRFEYPFYPWSTEVNSTLAERFAAKWPKSRRTGISNRAGVSEQGGWTGEYSNPSQYGAEPSPPSPWTGQYSDSTVYGQHGALPLPAWTGEYSRSESEVDESSQVLKRGGGKVPDWGARPGKQVEGGVPPPLKWTGEYSKEY